MFFSVLILSIIEGITEFLPVSSTGHLLLVSHYLNLDKSFYEVFDIAIQLGAILAVVSLYPTYFFKAIQNPFRIQNKILVLAMLPILIIGFCFRGIIQAILFQPMVIFLGLLIGGVALIVVDLYIPKKSNPLDQKLDVTFRQGLWIGLWQCLALWPGMSRSAMTIIGGLVSGLNRVTAASFSFVMAVPLMMIIVAYDLISAIGQLSMVEFGWVFMGIFCSYGCAFFTMKWFLNFVKNKGLFVFGVYRIIIALIGILLSYDLFSF
ncbi:MAG: undecaprenyl-diphosphate phosphatase [Candidatus Margulisiibacteriota bacterium]